jgi:hypothetical protein
VQAFGFFGPWPQAQASLRLGAKGLWLHVEPQQLVKVFGFGHPHRASLAQAMKGLRRMRHAGLWVHSAFRRIQASWLIGLGLRGALAAKPDNGQPTTDN